MDDFEKLRAALKAAPPATDPAEKARVLARAMENFDRRQETAKDPRPTQDRPQKAGFLTGVRAMLSKLTDRPALAATASVAALCVALVVFQPGLLDRPETLAPPQPLPKPEASIPAQKDQAPVSAPQDARTRNGAASATGSAAVAQQPAEEADQTVLDAAPDMLERKAAAPEGELADGTVLYEAAPSAAPAAPVAQPEEASAATAATDTEAFPNADQNPVKITAEAPVSTFSVDVDTASYAVVRSSLTAGALPPAEAVRVEEMVNYFP